MCVFAWFVKIVVVKMDIEILTDHAFWFHLQISRAVDVTLTFLRCF